MQTFEWDRTKAQANSANHRVTFDEAVTVFQDPFSLTIVDASHSGEEERHVEIGISAFNRILVIVYTERGANIRVISARKATKAERRTYEEKNL
jgi:hypothetical protein